MRSAALHPLLLAGACLLIPAAPALALPAPAAAEGGLPVLVASAAGAASLGAVLEPEGPLTLDRALEIVLDTHPRLEAARARVAAAKSDRRRVRGETLPLLTLGATGQFQGPEASFSGGGGSGGGGREVVFTPDRTAEFTLNLSAPIYSFGRFEAAKRRVTQAELAAMLRLEAEGQALVLETAETYLNLLDAREQLDLAAALRTLEAERLRVARVREGAGLAIPLEVTQAEADLAQAVQREIEVAARVRQNAAALNVLLGRPASAALEVATVIEDPHRPPEPLTVDVAGALERRPDLRALRTDVKVADAAEAYSRAARRPMLRLAGDFLRRLPETLLGGFTWSLGASIVQTLFDGGRSRSQVEAARAEQKRTGAELSDAERQADREVESVLATLDAAQKRLTSEEARIAAAEEALRAARRRVEAGVAADIVVTEAETVLTRARTDALAARYDLARARVRLTFAAGQAYPDRILPAVK